MKKIIFGILALLHLFSCSQAPTTSNAKGNINLDGVWQATYNRMSQIVIENESSEFLQTSKLTITENQYRFEFDPPAPQTVFHFDLIKEISGKYKIEDSLIYFYDSTGLQLKQELLIKMTQETLSFSYPMNPVTLPDGSVVVSVPLGAIPWGYAMNVWEPFTKVE